MRHPSSAFSTAAVFLPFLFVVVAAMTVATVGAADTPALVASVGIHEPPVPGHRHHRRSRGDANFDDDDAVSSPNGTGVNITARFECDANCSAGSCQSAQIPLGTCFFNPLAKAYIRYLCLAETAQVRLEVYGPFESLCASRSFLHLNLTYAANTCVLPFHKIGGFTFYECPV